MKAEDEVRAMVRGFVGFLAGILAGGTLGGIAGVGLYALCVTVCNAGRLSTWGGFIIIGGLFALGVGAIVGAIRGALFALRLQEKPSDKPPDTKRHSRN